MRSWDILSMHRCESTKVFITHALSDLVYFGNERGHRVFHKEQATGLGSARWQRLYMRVRIVTEIGSPLLHHHRPAITAPYCHPFAHSPIRPFAHSPIRPFAHSPIRPFAHSPIRPFGPLLPDPSSRSDEQLLNFILRIPSANCQSPGKAQLTLTAWICAFSSLASFVVTLAAITGLETPHARPSAVFDGRKT